MFRLEKSQKSQNNFALVKPPVPPLHSTSSPANLMLKAGIVGLPNVGKSTLFNALTRSRKAEAANYPFCTIDPNVGVVIVLFVALHMMWDGYRGVVIDLHQVGPYNAIMPNWLDIHPAEAAHHRQNRG